MKKYRIVRVENHFEIQKRFLLIFWMTLTTYSGNYAGGNIPLQFDTLHAARMTVHELKSPTKPIWKVIEKI